METVALERSLWIDATPERIWQAVTEVDQLIQWLNPNLVPMGAQMQRDERDTISVLLGPISVDFIAVEGAEEHRQITLRSLPDRLISTTLLLDEEKGGTSVSVRVNGFESLLDGVQEDRRRLSDEAWENTLKNLQAFVNGADLPFPNAMVSPLFGYWREAKTTLTTERSIWIDTPRQRVWKAVTDPQEIQRWMSPTIPWELSALEVGGRYYVRNEETNAEMYAEVIELLDPPRQLATRTVPEPPETTVKGKTYTLKEENNGTRLIITISGYAQGAEETRNIEQDTFGLGMMLQNTKAFIEGEDLPFPGGF
jgi:uncharacterized protein YndB with AHSA1/START domain